MAKRKENNPGSNQNTAWDEAGLSKLTKEKLLEVAKEFELAFTENPSEEAIIEAILKVQKDDSDPSQEDPDKPDNPSPPPADTSAQGVGLDGKVRIKNEKCKNSKLFLGNGKLAEFDTNGIAEIEASQAERLLKIPGYEKA